MMDKKLKQLKKKELRAQIRQNELRSVSIDQLADSVTALAGGSFGLKPLHEIVNEAIQQGGEMMTYSELEKSVEDIVRKLEEFCTKNKLSAKNFLALRGMIYGAAERGAEAQELHNYKPIHEFDPNIPIDPNMCVKEAIPTNFDKLACVMAGHPLAER